MSDNKPGLVEERELDFDFDKGKWPAFVRGAKQKLYERNRKARWTIETNPETRKLLKEEAAATPEIPPDAPAAPENESDAAKQM